MTRHATRKAPAREYQAAHPGMTLTEAKRHLAHAKDAGVVLGDVPLAELGGTVLPPDATLRQRARAEAIWRPAEAGKPCRCTGACSHGAACATADDEADPDRCTGRLVHLDRYPGGLFSLTIWQDEYACDTCGDHALGNVELPGVPWGERAGDNGTVVYDGVRHPNFRDVDDEDGWDFEEGCPECGAEAGYPCTCGQPECGEGDPYDCVCAR
ncbi:hypothetical protein [Amycolatopsis minnesotensis]|uniref:Uncharacterized protein n=1 Tax=Amycolatopsis minnesotensis TaxID=337894 RepID=A0ABP5DPT0_9PSEU